MEELKTNNGFVKLPRSILHWEWYDHPDVSRMYIHLLIKVNYAPARWRGIDILKDEHITSVANLSAELRMSEFKVRESLSKLEQSGVIIRTATNRFTKIKLVQLDAQLKSLVPDHKQICTVESINPQSNQKQTSTNKRNKEEIESKERKEVFKNEISKFSASFPREHLEGFYEYWSTGNKQTGRLKFEEERNWNIELKIKTWVVFPKKNAVKSFTKNR